MATIRLAIGPSSVSSAPRADRVVLDWYASIDRGEGPDSLDSDGYIVAREGVPSTEAGWLAHVRGARQRHDRAPRCPVVLVGGRRVACRWADATISEGGYDYRSGALLTWEV